MSSTAVQKDNALWEAKNDTASDSHYFYKNSGSPARTRDRAVLIKVDLVVVPIVGMFYLLSFLDKANIGNARIAGLQRDLKMTNHQFSTALTVTYVPYILMEIPMNLLMKRIGANITLPTMVILWGIVCACQGAVKTYGGLIACRFFLGAMEGGIFPGIVLYLSSFYKRHVLQTRFSLMFSVTSLAGAFSGLLAAAIQNMDGIRGLTGWAWIFILEGVFTTAFGLISMFFMPATPADMPWLTNDEKTIYLRELAEDWSGDDETDMFSWSEVWSVFVDGPHVLLLCLPMFLNGVMLFGLANFVPTIVNALGFSPTHSQLLAAPPYACSFVVSVMCSYFADRYRQRGPMCIFVNLIATAGYAIFLGTSNRHANYAALFLQIVGVYSTAPCIGTWSSNNVQPHYRRATAIGLNFICTNIGGIVSTWIFTHPPRFHDASVISLSASLGTVFFSGILMAYLKWRNGVKLEQVDRLTRENGEGLEPGGWNSHRERMRLGDRHPSFRFTL